MPGTGSAQPLISCIVPACNYGRFISQALDSILAQTYRPIEIVVVDAGSTDNTREVVAGYGGAVRYVYQPDLAPAQARNAGIGLAQGEFVAFLDADDIWRPDKLARQLARFAARPELGYCITHVQMFWSKSLAGVADRMRSHPRAQPVPGYATVTLLARRELFETVGLLNPALWSADSVDWFLRAAEMGVPMELLPDVLVYRRMHGDNLTRRKEHAFRREWLRFVKARLDKRRSSLAADLPGFVAPDFGVHE